MQAEYKRRSMIQSSKIPASSSLTPQIFFAGAKKKAKDKSL
jgi:hypothetical protein